jgi:hypothetical protein
MTKRNVKTLWAAALIAMFTAAASPSQAGQVSCKVPFSFAVNSAKTLPPGEYTLSSTGPLGTVLVRGASGGVFSTTNRLESRTETEAKLVFHKYGDTYILRQVWMGNGTGRELPRTQLERDLMERKVAGGLQRIVIVAAR